MTNWSWIWPYVGATPISEGLDSEIFDREDYPYTDTFVREAIQNSLDAKLDDDKPVIIKFRFHESDFGPRAEFLRQLIDFRRSAGLSVPRGWSDGRLRWITIEDFNASGLGGSLSDRMSDFWNYWLNFGISNKDGSGRGGRGIGRVTFLIASQIKAVLGLTKRFEDGRIATCGMGILKAIPEGNSLRSTHAYLASSERGSIYNLHESPLFYQAFQKAFRLIGYSATNEFGLALVIPYPHDDLQPEGILASAIEHFAPAVMARSLVVQVNDTTLDRDTIGQVAAEVADNIRTEAVKNGVGRYLALVQAALDSPTVTLHLNDVSAGLSSLRDSDQAKRLRKHLSECEMIALRINFPLVRIRKDIPVSLRVALARAPAEASPIDRLFREGMSLPDVKARSPGDLESVFLIQEPELAKYLNFCEGRAHLDLSESKEIFAKLQAKGYEGYRVRRFVKKLPTDIRQMLAADAHEPDSTVFEDFFSVSDERRTPNRPTVGRHRGVSEPPPAPPPIPPPKEHPLLFDTLADGFRARANPKYSDWPVNCSITIAYADGTRKPDWTKEDFAPSELDWSGAGCSLTFEKNRLQALNCSADCAIEVTGFDEHRELDTTVKTWKDAQAN